MSKMQIYQCKFDSLVFSVNGYENFFKGSNETTDCLVWALLEDVWEYKHNFAPVQNNS